MTTLRFMIPGDLMHWSDPAADWAITQSVADQAKRQEFPTVTQCALALVNAYGGDVPPRLRDEVTALIEAIERENFL